MRLARYDEQKGDEQRARKRLSMVLRLMDVFKAEPCDDGFSSTFYQIYGENAEKRIRAHLEKGEPLFP